MYYAGIGARKTPEDVQTHMTEIARQLEIGGFVLRSGGADGADSAFERGVVSIQNKEIYLPWPGFNNNTSHIHPPERPAYCMAKRFHPAWANLTDPVRHLMARNSHQIFGENMISPVKFVLCWTPDGKASGGTGQAIRIAEHYEIPVFNINNESWLGGKAFEVLLNTLLEEEKMRT